MYWVHVHFFFKIQVYVRTSLRNKEVTGQRNMIVGSSTFRGPFVDKLNRHMFYFLNYQTVCSCD